MIRITIDPPSDSTMSIMYVWFSCRQRIILLPFQATTLTLPMTRITIDPPSDSQTNRTPSIMVLLWL